MKNHIKITGYILLCAGQAFCIKSQAKEKQKPNIIMFLVDDMGWQDTSVPFWKEGETPLNRRFRTPNMERLASMGVRFDNAYACAISSPTRCSLMSGMNASRHRVTNWTLELNTMTDAKSDEMILPDWNYNGIQPESSADTIRNSVAITPLPKILKDNGYYTIHCGKAHFGARHTPGGDPSTMGFDINIGGGPNGAPGSYLGTKDFGKGSRFEVKGLEKYHGKDIFLTEALTIEAKKAIEHAVKDKKPFYLYMSHYAVHSPYDEDKRFSNNYSHKYDEMLKDTLNKNEVIYAALVEGMDKSLGDLMDYIAGKPEVAENTIILFMSDNGGQSQRIRQGVENRDQNYPLRGGKGSAFLGGVREPMIVYWPGVTEAGTVNSNKIMIEDFYPTILEMAGIKKYKTIQKTDGESFVCLLKHPDLKKEKTIVWHFPNLWGETQNESEGYGAYSAIIKGKYHLIYQWRSGKKLLFDIERDIREQNDISGEYPNVVYELSSELTSYLKQRDAQRPISVKTGKELPYPDGSEN